MNTVVIVVIILLLLAGGGGLLYYFMNKKEEAPAPPKATASTQAPTQTPTQGPVQAPTQAPTQGPVQAPVPVPSGFQPSPAGTPVPAPCNFTLRAAVIGVTWYLDGENTTFIFSTPSNCTGTVMISGGAKRVPYNLVQNDVISMQEAGPIFYIDLRTDSPSAYEDNPSLTGTVAFTLTRNPAPSGFQPGPVSGSPGPSPARSPGPSPVSGSPVPAPGPSGFQPGSACNFIGNPVFGSYTYTGIRSLFFTVRHGSTCVFDCTVNQPNNVSVTSTATLIGDNIYRVDFNDHIIDLNTMTATLPGGSTQTIVNS